MASLSHNNKENIPGSVFTDTTCIDCGTCFHLAPVVFEEINNASVVVSQPDTLEQWSEVKRAIVSCPTNSIGIREQNPLFKEAALDLPLLIADNVYYCGFTAKSSYGATTYLIRHEKGNILVDSPRFHPLIVKELEKLGGVHTMLLSHRDDVADHQKFHDHFGCQRIIHRDELSAGTKNCEIILEGGEDQEVLPELMIVRVPGHTKGHVVALYRDKFLFTGDHLFVDQGHLYASKGVCWYSWEEQLKSTRKLLAYDFQWVLPGHGGWTRFTDSKRELEMVIKKMESR